MLLTGMGEGGDEGKKQETRKKKKGKRKKIALSTEEGEKMREYDWETRRKGDWARWLLVSLFGKVGFHQC
jgi:hypothetical protein